MYILVQEEEINVSGHQNKILTHVQDRYKLLHGHTILHITYTPHFFRGCQKEHLVQLKGGIEY